MKNELKYSAVAFLILMGVVFAGISYAKHEDKGDTVDSSMRLKMSQLGWPQGHSITISTIFAELPDGVMLYREGDSYIASATNATVYSDRPANALGGLWMLNQ